MRSISFTFYSACVLNLLFLRQMSNYTNNNSMVSQTAWYVDLPLNHRKWFLFFQSGTQDGMYGFGEVHCSNILSLEAR